MALIFLLQTRLFTVVVKNIYKFALRVVTYPCRLFTGALEQDGPDNRSNVHLVRGRKRRLMMGMANGRASASRRWKLPWDRKHIGEMELGKV